MMAAKAKVRYSLSFESDCKLISFEETRTLPLGNEDGKRPEKLITRKIFENCKNTRFHRYPSKFEMTHIKKKGVK